MSSLRYLTTKCFDCSREHIFPKLPKPELPSGWSHIGKGEWGATILCPLCSNQSSLERLSRPPGNKTIAAELWVYVQSLQISRPYDWYEWLIDHLGDETALQGTGQDPCWIGSPEGGYLWRIHKTGEVEARPPYPEEAPGFPKELPEVPPFGYPTCEDCGQEHDPLSPTQECGCNAPCVKLCDCSRCDGCHTPTDQLRKYWNTPDGPVYMLCEDCFQNYVAAEDPML